MNHHQLRLLLGFLIAVLVLTAFFLLLTKSTVVIVAYFFALLALVLLYGTFLLVVSGSKNKYLTNAAFPIHAITYGVLNLTVCGFFVLLDLASIWSIPIGWFCMIHIVLLAFFAWRILALDAGQEIIGETEKKVQKKTIGWKTMLTDAESILNHARPSCKKDVSAVRDAMRYADPVTVSELEAEDEAIHENLLRLGLLVEAEKAEEISALCITLQRQIRERGVKVKLLKY